MRAATLVLQCVDFPIQGTSFACHTSVPVRKMRAARCSHTLLHRLRTHRQRGVLFGLTLCRVPSSLEKARNVPVVHFDCVSEQPLEHVFDVCNHSDVQVQA